MHTRKDWSFKNNRVQPSFPGVSDLKYTCLRPTDPKDYNNFVVESVNYKYDETLG